MKLRDLSSDVLDRIKRLRYDRILEKHEGPEKWSGVLEYYGPEFLAVNGQDVLLPIAATNHKNITILRTIVGDNGASLILFLKDTTRVSDPRDEAFFAGYIAICDRMPGEEFYIAIVYHSWFMGAAMRLT